ncbi:MAG TPA: response regulator [Vicinamibacterales bacterium]|jgi:CheY-like chemotaxis protein|nr:response regulator [Vicinamibacterales bacterium]
MKVLIIDDEPHIREMMSLTLEAAGYEVGEAADGEEGLVQFGDGDAYDVVLLDQRMPGIDGLETLRRLLARTPDARIVMVTAYASVELAVEAMRLGATNFLRKPMTPEALRGAVAGALAERPFRRERRTSSTELEKPAIEAVTLNGFRFVAAPAPTDATNGEHTFRVRHFGAGTESTVTVSIDPEAIARVERLTGRVLHPNGAFWREQAEQLLAEFLWSQGRMPENGRLIVQDVTRDDLDVAAVWQFD